MHLKRLILARPAHATRREHSGAFESKQQLACIFRHSWPRELGASTAGRGLLMVMRRESTSGHRTVDDGAPERHFPLDVQPCMCYPSVERLAWALEVMLHEMMRWGDADSYRVGQLVQAASGRGDSKSRQAIRNESSVTASPTAARESTA